MSSHKPIVVGNWKMNPVTKQDAVRIFNEIKDNLPSTSGIDITICPPFVFIPQLKEELGSARKLNLGAQDVFWKKEGSFTGEISPNQLSELGVKRIIVGHSERRALGETDEDVARKVAFSVQSNLDIVLCVGEKERDEDGQYLSYLESQINASLTGVSSKYLGQVTIAYEPIWAIGGKRAMESTEIHEMVVFIRRTLSRKYGKGYAEHPRIIYGGSVNSENIESIMEDGEVDGVLPGRASREPKSFAEIVQVVKRIRQ